MTDLTAADMMAAIRDLSETLPSRCPTTLRVGPGVLDVLRRSAQPAGVLGAGQLPFGVRVVEDDTYPPGVWKIFDQWDDEISDGLIPVPGATVAIKLDDGTSKRMQVMDVDLDKGQYTVADPAILEAMPVATRWFW